MTGQSTGCPSSVVVAVAALAAGLLPLHCFISVSCCELCVHSSDAVVAWSDSFPNV